MASHNLPRTAIRRGVVPKATGKHALGSRRRPHMTEHGAFTDAVVLKPCRRGEFGLANHAEGQTNCGPLAMGSQSTTVGLESSL